ncbi:hypothetical protein MMC22_003294 [Lobaria immixta]|nr:hypothetical protein [Lobaria immixta]
MKVLRQITSCVFRAALLLGPALVKGAPTSGYSNTRPTNSSTFISAATSPAFPIGFSGGPKASVDGRLFNIDGKTQYFAGTNTWWLGYLKYNADVDLVLQQLKSAYLKVTRVWGFGNVNELSSTQGVYYQLLNSSGQYINYDPDTGIARLDYVVSAAEREGIKLVVPMLNNWDALGGINTYTNAFGGDATTFFTDAPAQAAYKNYISFIVNRYKDSPAIFAWELCNEPRCHGCATSVITNWASDISSFIKSLDPTHMVALGDEGWFAPGYGDGSYAYSGSEGVDFIQNLAIPTLDYGTVHLYPDQWGYPYSWGNQWIQQHDAVGKSSGKPIVLEEYGSPFPGNHTETEKPWQQTVLQSSSVAYDSFWQFGTQLKDGKSAEDDYSIEEGTPEYEILATQHAVAMLGKEPVAS